MALSRWERAHRRNMVRIQKLIDKIYQTAIREAGQIGEIAKRNFDASRAFSLDEWPVTQSRVQSLLESLQNNLNGAIVDGVQSAWTLSNNKNNELCNAVFGSRVAQLSLEQYRRYYSNNYTARDAFIARRDAGMNLSDRVWNYTSQFKAEMEQVLDVGIRNGMSASEMSQDLKQYLNNPDNFFRRFRYKEGVDEAGKPIYGKQWKRRYFDEETQSYKWENVDLNDYRPGRGVYRSSYKNAMRLAGTETNMAYRSADHERWQQMDFVVGIKIEVSNTNHPIPDICDELAGDYPKDFKWTGWHPHCRCHALSILKTEEEMAEDNERILRGEEPLEDSVNEVATLPKNFTDWVANNQERIDRAKSLPYFYRDNKDLIIQQTIPKQKGIFELAAERHASRTPEQMAAIQERWNTRRIQGISEQFYGLNLGAGDPLTGRFLKLLMHTDSPSFADDFSALKTDVQKAWDAERKAVEKIQMQLGIKKGKHSAWAQAMLKEEKKNAARKADFATSKQTLDVAKKSKECNVSTTRGGIPIVKPTSCRSQAYNPTDFLIPLSQLPIELRGTLERIDLVDWYNIDDAYWKKVYKDFTRSWATGGNGTVTFYRNTKAEAAANDLLYTLSHECGHNLDRKHGGAGWLSDGKLWQDAMAADKKKSSLEAVTEYGKNSLHEDFADSCMLYVTNPSKLKATFPNRYKIIRALLHRY